MEGKGAEAVGTRWAAAEATTAAAAADTDMAEQNVGQWKCHKPVCGNWARRAEAICAHCDQ